MKDPMIYVERFCYRHPRFGIPNLMRYVSIGSAAFWLIGLINPLLYQFMLFSPALVLQGQVWRLLTFFFIPPSTGILGLIGVYFYYWIGSTLENQWGAGPFTLYFFFGTLLTMLCGFLFYLLGGYDVLLEPYYVYLAMFFAFAVLYPDVEVLLFFIIPVKIKYLAYLDAAFFAYGVLSAGFPLGLLPVVAVLNFLVFCGGELWRRLRGQRRPDNTVKFRREAARIRREQQSQLYHHKCAVCGRTDADHPELEFRYCSRCQGYHCFCQDHINNHIHFTQ